MHFLLASRNRHKIRELEDILAADISGVAVHSLDEVGFAGDIDENGTTFDANARIKARAARAAALRAGHPDWYCLGDDSGLSVDALGGAPGVYSARFAGQHGDDAANNALLLQLIGDILDLSKIEAGTLEFNFSDFELNELMHEKENIIRMKTAEGVELIFEPGLDACLFHSDRNRLSQLLINLLTNAGKFTSEGSITLGVEIDEERGEVLFSVADTGPGIPPDKQDLVFNRFEKLDGNKKKGTGLGLAICRQIAMIVGGRIWVDSAYTGGARFVFAHPIGIDPGGENREGGGISTL